jgi:hypothetical protein
MIDDELDLELAAIDRTQLARDVVAAVVAANAVTDPTRLANLAFHIHHPDRDLTKRIDPKIEAPFAAEWRQLAASIVKPALATGTTVTTSDAPAKSPAASGRKILLIGDSHTYGAFGQELERLLAATGATVERHAKIGSWIQYWQPLVADLVRKMSPTDVVVALGANMRHGYPASGTGRTRQVQKFLATIRGVAPAARITWIGPPHERDDTEAALARDNKIITAGLDGKVTFIDSGPQTPEFHGAKDGVHYDVPTGKKWARGVFAQMR